MDFVNLSHTGCGDGDARADRSTVALGADETKQNAMVGVARFVEKQGRRTGGIEDDYVEIAIVVDVAKGGATTRLEGAVIEPGAIRNFVESPVSQVAKQLYRLAILDFVFKCIHQGGKVAVGNEDVGPAVVVEIAEAHAPLYGSDSQRGNFGFRGHVREEALRVISI